jgi:hypothetical protein
MFEEHDSPKFKGYDSPNTCYAIGDAVAVIIGTADVTRQPSSGVEEKITSLLKNGTTDVVTIEDATSGVAVVPAAVGGSTDIATMRLTGYMITNGLFINKTGTTDRLVIMGVQTNA